jgi:Spy/CpxP family protein refolding chaperone
MRRMHTFSVLFLAATLMLAPTMAQAAQGDHMADFFKELGVSPQQTASIQQIHAQAQPQMQAARTTLRADRANLRQQVASANATDAQLMTLYTQVASDAATMHKLRFEMLLKVRAVLTPAQRQQAAAIMQKHKGNHDHGDHDGDRDNDGMTP